MSYEISLISFGILCGIALLYIVTNMELSLRENGVSGISPKKEDEDGIL